VAAVISQVPYLDRDTQTDTKPQHVVAEMKTAAAEGRYLAAVGQPHEAHSLARPELRSVGVVLSQSVRNLSGETASRRLGC
jgi:hypothetical protein